MTHVPTLECVTFYKKMWLHVIKSQLKQLGFLFFKGNLLAHMSEREELQA